MRKQTVSTFVPNGKQKIDSNRTTYNTQKNFTITRSETSGKIESVQTKYQKGDKLI